MQCSDVRDELLNCAYNEIAPERRDAVVGHLADCEACRKEWHALEEGQRMLQVLNGDEELPAIDVRRLFHTAARRAQQQRRRWKRLAVACAAAAVLVFAVLLAGIRVEASAGRVLVTWGERPHLLHEVGTALPKDQRVAELVEAAVRGRELVAAHERRLAELTSRINAIDELARLATAELLSVDNRHAREIAGLRAALARSERGLRTTLNDLREQNDLRWGLTVHEFSQRPALTAVSVVESATPAQ